MEPEVVEVDVAPAAAVGIDEPDHDVFAEVGGQVGHDPFQIFAIVARGSKDDLAGVASDELDARRGTRAARDQEARERLGDPERDGGQSSLGRVSAVLECSDPEPALVPALHVAATPADGVAVDRLALEGIALGRPVAQIARFETEIERSALPVWGTSPLDPAFPRVNRPVRQPERRESQDSDQSEPEHRPHEPLLGCSAAR